MLKKSLLIILCSLGAIAVSAQTVRGTITDSQGTPLIGVNVLEQNTVNGTVSDLDGNYELNVSTMDAVLVFSYTGYANQEVMVAGQSIVDVQLEQGVNIDEVVVTALGISREKKSLTYSAQNVNTEELGQARELNVVNSLSGKVAGISISPGGNGVGSDSRVILRGNRSIAGSSQPLYVVDGVPIIGDITDINPDDIASISVLKGPNAAALYGNRANNGAIIISTKQAKAGTARVSVNTTYTSNSPIILTDYQNEFGQGNAGQYSPASEDSWGAAVGGTGDHWSQDPNFPEATYTLQAQPDNVEDFFQTGFNWATNLSISGGTERMKTYFSYTFTQAEGIVPSNDLERHNFHVRINNQISDKLSVDAKLNYIREDIDNSLATGENFANPIRHALRLPRTIRTSDVAQFEYTDAAGRNRQHYWNPGSNGGANPYWTINRNTNQRDVDRIIGLASIRYEITDNIAVQVRSALDRLNRQNEDRLWVDSYIIADNGRFTKGTSEEYEWNNDVLVSYQDEITPDFDLSFNIGANSRKERGTTLTANTGDALIVPNFFSIGNTSDNRATFDFGRGSRPRNVNSVYAFAQLAYKDAIYLDVTGRNDWSSTLPSDNWSFFYPSFGVNVVLSDLTTLPDFITFAKLRGSWAEVGNDTDPFQTLRTASVGAGGANGFLTVSGTIPNENLLPESTKSIEVGADLRFLNNRIGLDFTYYKSNSENQLFSVALPVGSGASQFFTNGGDVENKGIEAILSLTPISTDDFTWDIGLNFTRNRSTVVAINDERPRIQVGSDFLRAFFIEQGETWGNVFSRGFERDDQGRIIVDSEGLPQITAGRTVLVANYNPDWLGGISNNLNYRGLNLSFLVDIRQGGSVTSMTNAIVYGGGHTVETLPGRDGFVFGEGDYAQWGEAVKEDGTPNDLTTTAEAFWNKVGGRNAPAGEAFAVDASNVRLRELVVGYEIPLESQTVSRLRVSLVGRNLFFISNKAGDIDPEVLTNTGTAAEGFNSFAPPTTRSFGVNLQADF